MMQQEALVNQSTVTGQSTQDLFTYTTVYSQSPSFAITNATSIQTVVVPAQECNLMRSVLSFKAAT